MAQDKTFTDSLRQLASSVSTPAGKALHKLGVSPDVITILGLVVVALGSWRLYEGKFGQAAVILLLGLPLDTLDGAIARAGGKFRPFGSFLDSTLDRYADGLIMGAVALYFAHRDNITMAAISIVALHGTMMVSYIRAKSESLNIQNKVGLFTRVERLLTLLAAWILSFFVGQKGIDFGIYVLAIGTQFTALQRMYHVSRALSRQADEETKPE